jgi:hypothetical protein
MAIRRMAERSPNDWAACRRDSTPDTREDAEIAADGAQPLLLADGEWIGFFDTRKMNKVGRGGTPVPLADAQIDSARFDMARSCSRAVTEPLFRIPESGHAGRDTTLDIPGESAPLPSAPTVGRVAFTVQTVDSPGGYDDASIDAAPVKTGSAVIVQRARCAARVPGDFVLRAVTLPYPSIRAIPHHAGSSASARRRQGS